MRLTSSDFSDEGRIPRVCACDGEDASPALAWIDAPPAARSFVLLCNDPDAPDGVFRHWAAYDIPHALVASCPRRRTPDGARASEAGDQRLRAAGLRRPLSAARARLASLSLHAPCALGRQARRPRRPPLPGRRAGGAQARHRRNNARRNLRAVKRRCRARSLSAPGGVTDPALQRGGGPLDGRRPAIAGRRRRGCCRDSKVMPKSARSVLSGI